MWLFYGLCVFHMVNPMAFPKKRQEYVELNPAEGDPPGAAGVPFCARVNRPGGIYQQYIQYHVNVGFFYPPTLSYIYRGLLFIIFLHLWLIYVDIYLQ